MRTGVLFLNHGAAATSAGLETLLSNIFSDRDIIRLPGGRAVQERLARLIARWRAPKVAELYGFMGGGSPLVGVMERQAVALRSRLAADGLDMPVLMGLRYFPPYIADAVRQAIQEGIERLIVLPQYPQYSMTTVGSVCTELERALAAADGRRPETVILPSFGDRDDYVAAMAAEVREVAGRMEARPRLLFSAHAVPMKFVEAGDPYPDQVRRQAALIAAASGFGDEWEVSFQSRSGPVRWLGPDTREVVPELARRGVGHVLVVPISFIQDHLETLVEIDVQLSGLAWDHGMTVVRVRPLEDRPEMIEIMARMVRGALAADHGKEGMTCCWRGSGSSSPGC